MAGTAFSAIWAPRVLSGHFLNVAPSLGWFCSMIVCWNSLRIGAAISVVGQSILAYQLFSRFGTTSTIVNRVCYLPLLSSSLAAFASLVIKPKSSFTIASVSLIQLWSIIGGLVVLACFPVSVITSFSPQFERDQAKSRTIESLVNEGFTVQSSPVEHRSGIVLDTLAVMTKDQSKRWIVYCGGNGEFLEQEVSYITPFATSLHANIILFNSRGVGKSTGYVWDMGNLVEDASAVVNFYVKKYSVDLKNLLLFGHSIGGGIVLKLAAEHFPDSPVLVDRSFSALSDAAITFSPFSAELTRSVFPYLVGDLNSIQYWNRIHHSKKLVTFAKKDEMIAYGTSSIARLSQFSKGGCDEDKVIELHGRNIASWHNSPIFAFEENSEILYRLNSFLM